MIDLALEFLEDEGYTALENYPSLSTFVYKLEKDGEFKVAKIGFRDDSYDLRFQPENEIRVLSDTKNIDGIVNLDSFYRTSMNGIDYTILIKEFVEGQSLDELNHVPFELVIKLQKIVDKVHRVGYAQLDLKPRNVVLKDNSPVIVDLGCAGKRSDFKEWSFEDHSELDYLALFRNFI